MSSLHLILPVEFFCEMYNQKAGFELTPETLPQLLAEVPSNFNPCAIKDGRILLKKMTAMISTPDWNRAESPSACISLP